LTAGDAADYPSRMSKRVSLYFFAGDFAEAVRRHQAGEPQSYATHDELAKLLLALGEAGFEVSAYSFMTTAKRVVEVAPKVRIVDLAAQRYDDPVLVDAFRGDGADATVLHFPHIGALRAGLGDKRRIFPVMANSYNKHGVRPWLERRRLVQVLNQPKFRWISNHCRPSTEHLASFGVRAEKLIPWDVPHANHPSCFAPKTLASGAVRLAYAGSVTEPKGVGDLVRAVALLRKSGMDVGCDIAGGGELDTLRALAGKLGVGDAVNFRGVVGNDAVVAMFRAADMVVVPSRPEFPEGFPLTIFEAIATRTPIVASDHPMFRSALQNRDTAMVFAASNADELAQRIRELIADPALYGKLSQAADESWSRLGGTADWRTMLFDWFTVGEESPYLARNALLQG
jgi:glycosyltransferase involved in cell wall biosynthesis